MLSQNPTYSYEEKSNIEIPAIAKPKILLCGFSPAKLGLTEDIGIYGTDGVDGVFGATQHLTNMVRDSLGILEKSFTRPQVDTYAFDNTSHTAAVFKLTISAATKNETIQLIAGEYTGYNQNFYELTVTSGQTGATIATALAAVINADIKRQFEATVSTNEVTLTAKAKGAQGSDIQVFVKNFKSLQGITVAISKTTDGVGEPSNAELDDLITAIAQKRYNYIVYPFSNISKLATEIRRRVANGVVPNNFMQDGVVITAQLDSAGDLITYSGNNIQTVRNPVVAFGLKKYENTNLFGGKYLISPSLLATKIATIFALAQTHNSGTVSEYFIQKTYGYPALTVNTALHNIILNDILDTGFNDFTTTEVTNLKNAKISLLSKEGTNVVTGILYTLTTSNKYISLQSELQSQFFKEFLINFTYYGDASILTENRTMLSRFVVFNTDDAKIAVKSLFIALFNYASGIDTYYDARSGIDYAVLQSSDANKKAFEELVDRTLFITKNAQNQGQLFITNLLDGVFAIENVFITINKQ
jgi:hypothetical protein